MDVFTLWHVHECEDGEEDAKLIGVHATADAAREAQKRAVFLPGFRDSPDCF